MTYRKLIEYCYNLGFNGCDHCEYEEACDQFLSIVGYAPKHYRRFIKLNIDKEITNDAIIRCKDCVNSRLMPDGTYICDINTLGAYDGCFRQDEDFCLLDIYNKAERKDEEGK